MLPRVWGFLPCSIFGIAKAPPGRIRSVSGGHAARTVPEAQGYPRLPRHIVLYTCRALRRRLESLASFCFPKPLHKRALTQALQSAVEMMPRISEGLVELPADLPQIQSLKIKQLKRDTLAFREFVKGF